MFYIGFPDIFCLKSRKNKKRKRNMELNEHLDYLTYFVGLLLRILPVLLRDP